MERIVLRHISGSKANQVEEFPLNHFKEIIIGRDPSSTVKYDPDKDDTVGRQHAKLTQNPTDPAQFNLSDLNSRNGTFLNKQKITGTTAIAPGDVVQLGLGGPEFQFDVEPRPQNTVRPTRLAVETSAATLPHMGGAPATRISAGSVAAADAVAASGAATPAYASRAASASPMSSNAVGKATVERMISHNVTEAKKNQGRRFMLIGGAALVAVVALFAIVGGAGYWLHKKSLTEQTGQISTLKNQLESDKANAAALATSNATAIAEKFASAVVFIEVSWRMIDTNKQAQVYHQFIPNDLSALTQKKEDIGKPIFKDIPDKILAAYVEVGDSYEPLLTYTANNMSQPIGGNHTGSGFIVTGDGFVLTNRHVAATWKTSYHFPQSTPPGLVFTRDGKIYPKPVPPPTDWVPANTQQTGRQLAGDFKGVNDTLDVTLSKKENRIAATLKQVSDRHDVALIKIDVPGQLTKVELFDNYDAIKPGDAATILGYPGDSPPVYGAIKSQDVFNRTTQYKFIPDPSVTQTNVSRVIRGQDSDPKKDQTFSLIGDVIQLSTASTGPGNSGGPVFDDHGRVIGIFFAGQNRGIAVTYAIPIRFGKEFLAGE